jgi:flagellar FliJ protein
MTQALHTVLEHAERQRDEAQAQLLRAEEAARQMQQQAEQVHAYRDEYRQRSPAQGGRSTSIGMLRVHQGFMQRLDQALQQVQGQVQATQARCDTLRAALVAQETRVAAVRKLLERRDQQARLDHDRREQRRADESAQRRRRDDGSAAPGWRLGTEPAPLTN